MNYGIIHALFKTKDFSNSIVHMNYIIEGEGALVNEAGEEQPLKVGDFTLVNPDEKHQYRNKRDLPFKMICGVPKEFEWKEIISKTHHLINLLMY